MDLLICSVADRPDLAQHHPMADTWPEFMAHDPIANLYYARARSAYPEFVLLAFEPEDLSTPVAKSHCVPFAMGGDTGRDALPDGGWDAVIMWAWLDSLAGRTPTHVSALEVVIRPDRVGTGLASIMLEAKRNNVAKLGFDELLAPVRPNAKHHEPRTPMADYVARTRDDDLPVDPWLRLHVRAGGTIEGVCSRSMTIPGTLAEWRAWTGLSFDQSGEVEVPFALNPVQVSVEHDHAVYVEPNVWVRHQL